MIVNFFPEHWTHEHRVEHGIAEILINQKKQYLLSEEQMSALTDLQAAVAKLQSDVTAFISANSGGASDADLQSLTAAVSAIDSAVAPPAPTT